MTEIGNCLNMLLHESGWKQTTLSALIHYDQGGMSKIISGKRRVTDLDLLRRLCHCWPDRQANLRVLMAHLRDIIGDAGYDHHHDVEVRSRGHHASSVSEAAEYVYAEALADEHVGRLVAALADALRSMRPERQSAATDASQLAAEPPRTEYRAADAPPDPPAGPESDPPPDAPPRPRRPRKPSA